MFYLYLFLLMTPPPPTSTLFPYTTLFRSRGEIAESLLKNQGQTPFFVQLALWENGVCPHFYCQKFFEVFECFSDRRSEEHTSELQSLTNLVCRLLLEKKKKKKKYTNI